MKSGRAALRYAKDLVDFSIEGQEEKNVFNEMQNILTVMQSSKDLDDVLNNPVLPTKQKRVISKEILEGKTWHFGVTTTVRIPRAQTVVLV